MSQSANLLQAIAMSKIPVVMTLLQMVKIEMKTFKNYVRILTISGPMCSASAEHWTGEGEDHEPKNRGKIAITEILFF